MAAATTDKEQSKPIGGVQPNQKYDWEHLFSQPEFTMVRGVDYTQNTYIMIQQIRNRASKPKYRVRVRITVAADGESFLCEIVKRGI